MSKTKVKILSEIDKLVWNSFVDNSPWGDILQFWQWGELKKVENWKPLRLAVIKDGQLKLVMQILLKDVPFLGKYAYVPHGPIFHSSADLKEYLPLMLDFLIKISKTYDFVVLEIEPKLAKYSEKKNPQKSLETNLETNDNQALNDFKSSNNLNLNYNLSHFLDLEILEIFQANSFKFTGRNMQPKHKLYYDLDLEEDELLNLCHKSTRYNIRLAKKKGVEVYEYLPDDPELSDRLNVFYDLLKETQDRTKGYPIRSLESFQKLFQVFKGTKHLALYEVKFENETIAMNISQRTKFWSSSFYAASNRKHTSVKAPYLLRWQSILQAKKYGSKVYDFWGVIPESEQHKGYSDHKLSFGGVKMETYGLLSFEFNPLKTILWENLVWLRTTGKIKVREIFWKIKEKASKTFKISKK